MPPELTTPSGSDNIGGTSELSSEKARRKRLFGVVLIVGLAAMVLGFLSLLNAISAPFPRPQPATNTATTSQAIEALKQQDTDQDGLSDYDEIFTHQTSVFVRDSDSDGVSDAEEAAKNTDPNCPAGKQCGVAVLTNSENVSANVLRQALLKSGVPAYILNQTSDAALLELYKEAVAGDANFNVNTTVSLEDLTNLTADQVRDLLRANGVDEQSLSQVDNSTLLRIYRDALKIQPANP